MTLLMSIWVNVVTSDKVIVESANDSEDSSDDEVPKKMTLQEAYDKLCTEFIKSENTSHLCRKELNEVKTEKADLLVKLDEITRLVETFVLIELKQRGCLVQSLMRS